MHLTVTTPRGALVQIEVDEIAAPGAVGEFGVLPGHTPLLGALEPGWVVRIDRVDEPELRVAVHGGFLSVREDGVSVLAEMAEVAGDIDVDRARSALDRADPDTGPDGAAARSRALARLRAAGETV